MQRTYNVWVVIRRAEDIEDCWIAHCLDFDVMTQGHSIPHAMEMLAEVTGLTVVDDLIHDRDPNRRRAPSEYWKKMYEIVNRSETLPPKRLRETLTGKGDQPAVVVALVEFSVRQVDLRRAKGPSATKTPHLPWKAPVAFQSTPLHAH